MPKAEKGSIKDIGKRIKAKGLQKLKFYCQMCEKQCRDANGFKCHLTSESHLRQMKVFSDNAAGYMDQYSRDFEKLFLETLRMRHGTSQVNANHVYQQVIQDKQHVHMNATIWATLTDFVKYLGKTGKCHVEENERGWYVTFIERDASKMARQEALQKRQAAELEAERLAAERMEQQRLAAAQAFDRATTGAATEGGTTMMTGLQAVQPTNLEEGKTIHIHLSLNNNNNNKANDDKKEKKKIKTSRKARNASIFDNDSDDSDEQELPPPGPPPLPPLPTASVPLSATRATATTAPATKQLDTTTTVASRDNHISNTFVKRSRDEKQTITTNEDGQALVHANKKKRIKQSQQQGNESDYDDDEPWLYRDILVRIVVKDKKRLDDKFFHRKATVDHLVDPFTAQVTVLDSGPNVHDGGDVLQLDQRDLETVVPKQTGKMVRIVKGEYRGKRAQVIELDGNKYRATLRIVSKSSSSENGLVLKRVNYADFSKLA